MSSLQHVTLSLNANPSLARLVRMTASNVAMLCSMSVERVEDARMAAEEAFIYACTSDPSGELDMDFAFDSDRVQIVCELVDAAFADATDDDPTSAYAELILGSVCDEFSKREDNRALVLELKADV